MPMKILSIEDSDLNAIQDYILEHCSRAFVPISDEAKKALQDFKLLTSAYGPSWVFAPYIPLCKK